MSTLFWPADLGYVVCVAGARPNSMKMAPIRREFSAHHPAIPVIPVGTGQHYDKEMIDRLVVDFLLPRPDILAGGRKRGRTPELWGGHAAERIAADLAQWLLGHHR